MTWVMWSLTSSRFETVLVSVQDWCKVFPRRTIGLGIVLDAPNGTPCDMGHVESHFIPFGDSVSVSAWFALDVP